MIDLVGILSYVLVIALLQVLLIGHSRGVPNYKISHTYFT